MRQTGTLPALLLVAAAFTAPAHAAGNFEFVVPAEAGLTLRISGYGPDGSQLFEATAARPEQRGGESVYVVRIDETIIKSNRLARWCAEDSSGTWKAQRDRDGAAGLCDDHPSEMRGSYRFKPISILAAAPVDAPAAVDVPDMSLAEAATCVQEGLNGLGFDAGPADGQMGRRTFNAAVSFAGLQEETYPALSDAVAAEWCVRIRTATADGSARAAMPALGRFQFGPDVDAQIAGDTQRALAEIHDYFTKSLGGVLADPGTIYVSADPEWMADRYVAHLKTGPGVRRGKVENFAGCHGGEAGFSFMFMCTKSDVFTGDWFGSGRQAQRTFSLTHEYFHMLQFERAVGRLHSEAPVGPHWLIEGAAEYVAFRILRDTGRMKGFDGEIDWHTQKAAEVKSSLKQMESRKGFYGEPRASSSGMIAAHLLAERSGLASLADFYSELGKRGDWKKAFETTFGLSVAAFYEEFDAHIH